MANQEANINKALVDKQIKFDPELNLSNVPKLIEYHTSSQSVEDFDEEHSSNWYKVWGISANPPYHKNLAIFFSKNNSI